jgi:hypothetical protein
VLRLWLRVYTWRLPSAAASARRAEIESDVWEMQHDRALGRHVLAFAIVMRMMKGAGDDLAWRIEQFDARELFVLRRTIAVGAATALVLALWTIPGLLTEGRDQVMACADATPTPQTTPELRLEVVRCAGAFFVSSPDP